MADIIWTSPAFRTLEKLPQKTAFGIIRQTDHLARFPLLGAPLGFRVDELKKYRQIVFRRRHRVIYRYSEHEDAVYLVAVQDCRQKLPAALELHEAETGNDMSVDE